jgi:sugar/nucleoside kinase (ribokinase family)
MTVVVVGDVVTDVLAVLATPLAVGSDTAADISFTGGGSAANTAAWLAHSGVPVTLVACVGTDAAGDARVAELTAAGVRTAVRRCPDAPTGTVVVLAERHERTMLADRGANLHIAPSDVDSALTAATRHVHVSGYTLFDPRTRPAGLHALAGGRGLTTSVDAASADPLRRAGAPAFLDWVRDTDLLFANLAEARVLVDRDLVPPALAQALTGWVRRAVVKLGDAGAVWADRSGAVVTVPAEPPERVVDPTGAGDAFAAGLLGAWLGGASGESALRAGALLGARAVALAGARPSHPSPI